MWRAILTYGVCLLFSFTTLANTDKLEILLTNNDTLKLVPGSTSNIVVKLINNSASNKNFQLKIDSAERWRCLTNFGAVTVEKKSKKIKILSIYVPEFTKSGNYKVTISAFDKSDKKKIGTVNIPVFVLPKYGILVTINQAPGYVISGDSLAVKFMVYNLSNVEATINATIKSGKKSKDQILTLAPDSSSIIRKTIITESGILQYKKQDVSLSATIVENPETTSTKYHRFNLIPSNKIKFDAYNRFPVKISSLFITGNRNKKREYAFMFDVRKKGVLNKKKGKELEFHFRGPNRKGESLLGIYDEYYAKYKSPRSEIIIGDHNYGLSYLTEFSRYGRGAGYKYTIKKLQITSFVNYPRFYPKTKRVVSFNTNYTIKKKYEFNAGYLNKQFATGTTAHLGTLSGKASPHKWVDLEMEYATGLTNKEFKKAYKTAIKVKYSFFNAFVNYTMADKNFPGYFSNSKHLATGAFSRISKKININFNYNFNHNNIALDTLLYNAPFSENLSFFTNFKINNNTCTSISLYQREREDRIKPKKFHYNEKTIRLSFTKNIKQLRINMQAETGKTTNYLTKNEGQITNMYRANFRLQYKLNESIFMNGFAIYNNRQLYNTDDNLFWYYGCSIDTQMGKKFSLSFNYQNNYEIEEYYRDRSIFSLNTKYTINRNNELNINGKYNLGRNTLNKKELEVMVKYVHTINVPVNKKKDLGILKGKIINKGVENIEGIQLFLGGKLTVSDKNGLFYFPVVKKGIQYLTVNYSNAGLNAIAEIPGPYKLDIIPGANNYFEIPLTKSAKISGNIVIKDDENKGKKGFVPIKVKLNKLIIEAKKDNEVFRKLTDNNGNFSFEGLRPGNWNVQVYKNGIPKEYELLTEFFNINMKSGQNETIEIELVKKQRRIKFQKNF